jgi:hypothetical protein
MRALVTFLAGVALDAVLLAQGPAPVALQKPADAVALALASVKTSPEFARHQRFLWLGNCKDAQERGDIISLVNFAVNSLSRRRLIVPATVVSDSLVGLDLDNYGIDPQAWEDLGSQGSGPEVATRKARRPEPFFHQLTRTTFQEVKEVLVDCEPYWQDGRLYHKRWEKRTGPKQVREQLLHGAWLPQEQVAALALLTQSEFPILEARWFVANALLPPAYQRLLGVKDLKGFQEQVRFRRRDDDLAIRGAVLISSEVAIHNRSLLRTPTVLGYYWSSLDFNSSVAGADVLANVLGERFDASEIIASGPNGLQQYFLINGQGQPIDFADPNVAIDRSTSWENKLVWCGLSCAICHSKGLKPFQDDVRRLADASKNVFAVVRQEHLERFTDLFGPDVDGTVTADQAIYARAVLQATGNDPEKNAANLSRVFLDYVQTPVTLERASFESGYSKDRLLDVIKPARNLDHVLTQLISGSLVRRDQFERAYGELLILLSRKGN